MSLNTLYDLFIDQLKDMYSAEKQLAEALPKMANAASNQSLTEALAQHQTRTEGHLNKVRTILDELDENPGNKVCVGMEGLIKEGQAIIEKQGSSAAKDAALIAAAQKVEHYEIASYGALSTYAGILDYGTFQNMLQDILDDEGSANEKLTDLAEGGLFHEGLNEEAAA